MAPKAEAPKKKVAKPAAKPAEETKKAAAKPPAKKEEPKKAEPKKEDVEMKAAEEPKVEAPEEHVPKEPDEPNEVEEQDAAPIKGAALPAGAVSFYTEDTTLNVMPAANGKTLMALGEGGLQYLMAGAKANVGLKSGRYMFEVVIAEAKNPVETGNTQGPKPRTLVRIGVSTAAAPLLMAGEATSVSFDSEGNFFSNSQKKKVSEKFSVAQVAALVVNLDASSPNANTLSLFIDGVRACKPQPIPDALQGEALYPAVMFKNATVQVNFGISALSTLPFTCHTVASAAKADCQVKPQPAATKPEVIFPVGLPDQGVFDWLDKFLAENRSYVELSDRAVINWITKSGIPKVKAQGLTSNDKPAINYGLEGLDDFSISKALWAVVPILNRNYVVMELKANLLAEERKKQLGFFPASDFKRSAHVVVGEPTADIKEVVRAELLKKKEKKVEEEKKKKKLQKEKEAERKRLLEVKKKKALDAKKAKEAKVKAAAKEKAGEDVEEAAEEEKEAEENGDSKEEEAKEPEPEAEEEETEVKVELTEEEEKTWYLPKTIPDLTPNNLARFTGFGLPAADEGFDEVRYEWDSESKAAEHVKEWIGSKKLTVKVDELQPSEWFKQQVKSWSTQLNTWKKNQTDFKTTAAKKAEDLKRKAHIKKKQEEQKAKADAFKKKKEEKAKKEAEENKDEEGEDGEAAEEEAEEKAEEDKAEENAEEDPTEDPMQIDAEELDPFAVENVDDIGSGEPLYAKFEYEDWALLTLRFELHLLCHAFRRDLNDPTRPSFHEKHLGFYYKKYYKKDFSPDAYKCSSVAKVVELIKDMIVLTEKYSTLVPDFPDDTPVDNFVKLAEEHRRQRARRVDMGDETAALKFPKQTSPAASTAPTAGIGPVQTARATYGLAAASPARPAMVGGGPASGIKRPFGAMAGPSAYSPVARPRVSYASATPARPYGAPGIGPGVGMYGRPMGAFGAPGGGIRPAYGMGAYSAYQR